MQVTINGEPQEASVTLRREAGQLGTEYLYVDDYKVARVTHSRADAVPVVLAIDEDMIVEVEPRVFYTIDGMHHDWQPGAQDDGLAST